MESLKYWLSKSETVIKRTRIRINVLLLWFQSNGYPSGKHSYKYNNHNIKIIIFK